MNNCAVADSNSDSDSEADDKVKELLTKLQETEKEVDEMGKQLKQSEANLSDAAHTAIDREKTLDFLNNVWVSLSNTNQAAAVRKLSFVVKRWNCSAASGRLRM